MTDLVVSEVFGPTIQGEGPTTGHPAAFVRLGRCNLTCVWCDTPYTWDWRGANGTVYNAGEELTKVDVEEVAQSLIHMAVPLVVITGGEPLLQGHGVRELALRLFDGGIDRIEFETNGTVYPPPELMGATFVHFNCSPKLANSGVAHNLRYRPDVLCGLADTGRACFKFVITNPEDLAEVDTIVDRTTIAPDQVWLMPEGKTATELAERRWLAEEAIARGYNLSTRLHVTLWGDTRGH